MAYVGGIYSYKGKLRLQMKRNEMYIANLKAGLMHMPNSVLGALAATALNFAVQYTKHDSSRFAANWKLSLSGQGIEMKMDPYKYGQSTEHAGTIGKRDSKGAAKLAVLTAKAIYYGYEQRRGGGVVRTPTENGLIYQWLDLGRRPTKDKPPVMRKIELYNPLTSPRYDTRKDGFGNTYAYNALFGKNAGLDRSIADKVGAAIIPLEIQKLSKRLKEMHRAGTL